MIGKWILFVIASVLSVQLFAETEAQRQQSIMSFEYLRAIGDDGNVKKSMDVVEQFADQIIARCNQKPDNN